MREKFQNVLYIRNKISFRLITGKYNLINKRRNILAIVSSIKIFVTL